MWIADPKAISHILKNSDLYKMSNSVRELIALVTDRGLLWADGNALFNLVLSNSDVSRRRTQAAKEGHVPRIWSR